MGANVRSVTEMVTSALGGQTALGGQLGVKQQVVGYWVNEKGRFPAEYVLHIESLLRERGVDIDRYDIRPDVYGLKPICSNSDAHANA